jgi:hypothetical protein
MAREALKLVHHHPGRLRLRAIAFEKDLERVERVRARLDAIPGIVSCEHRPTTGSLLVVYQPGLVEPDVIVGAIAAAAELDLPRDEPRNPNAPALVAIEVGRELNAAVADLTGARADLKTLVPGGLAALATYAFVQQKGERLPRWDNLLYWSWSIFRDLHRDVLAPDPKPTSVAPPAPTDPEESEE